MKGKILGSRYKIIEYLAAGGFSKTYLAEDTQLPGKDICLVKQLSPSRSDPKFLNVARRLFKTEASTLHNLGSHRQIPKLLAYFEEEEKFYLVQQYIKGSTLTKELAEGQKWSESAVIDFLRDGLKILQFVHGKGVIHRDIKPDNIIRRESDHQIVLVDFGSVKEVLQGQQTHIGQLTVAIGTQGYMPTEQARGKPRTTSDIYALGIIGIQALTGIAPLELPEDDEGEIIWESLANASPELLNILTRMTRYHFKDRYSTAKEVLQALDRFSLIENESKTIPVVAQQSAPIQQLSINQREINQQSKSLDTSFNQIPSFATNDDVLTDTAIKKHLNPHNRTALHKLQSLPKSFNEQIIKKVIAFLILSLLGLSAYLIKQSYFSQPQIKIPANQELNNQPNSSPERLEQGAGFRKDI